MGKVLRLAFATFVLSAVWLSAQSFLGTIGGTVSDSTGAVIPQAKIELTEVATGIKRNSATNAEGQYSFPDVKPGTYTVSVVATGFKEARSSNIILTAQQNFRFDTTLQVGESTQTVDVTATPPTLNTENAQLGDMRPREELLNLPLNQRSTINFFFLSSFNYQGDGSSYSLGGLRGSSTNFTIDGVTSNSSIFGGQVGPMTEESLDAVSEMKMLTSNNSAEFPNVGTILISSRSGTNAPHGSAFFLTSNNALNARNFFSPTKPKGPTRHELGASFGGPVYIPKVYNGRNKTFFYFTWEQQRFPGADTGTANVPTLAMRRGDFSSLLPDTVIYDPTTGQPFKNNVIPPERLSQVALKMQDFGFLTPNFGSPDSFSANWRGLFPAAEHNNRFVTRADHQISESDTLSARVSLRRLPLPKQFDADLPIFQRTQERQTRNAYVSETHTFGPRLINEARIGYSRDFSHLAGIHNGASLIQQFGIQGINADASLAGVPAVNFVNFANWFEFPTYFWLSETYEALDNVTLIKGSHNIKAGFLARYNRPAISEQPPSDFGTYSFDGFATAGPGGTGGFDYADFLLGIPHETTRYVRSQPRYNRFADWGAYIQDNFQVSPKLTLNLGLRFEYFQPAVDKNDMRFSFDPATGNLVVPNQKVLQTLVSPVFPKNIPIVTADQAGFPSRSLLNSDWHDFGPRIGFAYRPGSTNRTVIRAGYGIFYTGLTSTRLDPFGGGPFHSNEDFLNTITNGATRFQFPNPFPGVGVIGTQSINPADKNLRTPYTQQWNLTVEHELGASIVARATYRGFRMNRIPYVADLNTPPPSADPNNVNSFRYPNFYRVDFIQDGGIQKLNALDLGLERKFSQGLAFQAGWTWAKNLTDVGDDGESSGIENPYNRAAEMGNIYWMPRHRFVAQSLYELPWGRGKMWGGSWPGAMTQILGNWQISGVALFQTGQFLTPQFSGSDPSNTRTEGGRPDRSGDASLPNPTIARWFNPAAFAIPPNGRFGNSARGVIVGPGLANFDFGLFKYFNVTEKSRLQLRMTATNFFNHPNFGNPNVNISSGNVGVIRSLQGGRRDSLGAGARQIQLGFRYDF
jgi:hypothetical protein